jgi:hypothetical protein
VNVLRGVGALAVALLFAGFGWVLATDLRGVRRWQVLRSFGFADPRRPHPSWIPIPLPKHERMIQRQDRVARIVGWLFFGTGVLFVGAVTLTWIF